MRLANGTIGFMAQDPDRKPRVQDARFWRHARNRSALNPKVKVSQNFATHDCAIWTLPCYTRTTYTHTHTRAQLLNIVAQGKTRFPVMCFLCLLPDHFKCRVTMAILFNREIFIKRRLTENYRFQSKPASDQNINWTWNQLTPAPPSQRNEPKRGNDCAIHAPASQSHTSHEWVMTSMRGAMLLQHASALKAVGQLRKATDRQTDRAPQPDIEGQ